MAGQAMAMSSRVSATDRFRAMGTNCHVVVIANDATSDLHALLDQARSRIEELESRWSRFRPTSEISKLNRDRCGTVSPDTVLLIDRAVLGWRATNGRFDPTMEAQLTGLGYAQSFDLGPKSVEPRAATGSQSRRALGCSGIVVDRFSRFVHLPAGVSIDPGGIGKGLAADVVTSDLMAAGAHGVMVNIGGDLRVQGEPEEGSAWTVAIAEPFLGLDHLPTVSLVDGGLASSTPLRRAWTTTAGHRHHLLDPTAGASAVDGPDLVSVIAGTAWWAEVAATALAVSPNTLPFLESDVEAATAAHVVWPSGKCEVLGPFNRYRVNEGEQS